MKAHYRTIIVMAVAAIVTLAGCDEQPAVPKAGTAAAAPADRGGDERPAADDHGHTHEHQITGRTGKVETEEHGGHPEPAPHTLNNAIVHYHAVCADDDYQPHYHLGDSSPDHPISGGLKELQESCARPDPAPAPRQQGGRWDIPGGLPTKGWDFEINEEIDLSLPRYLGTQIARYELYEGPHERFPGYEYALPEGVRHVQSSKGSPGKLKGTPTIPGGYSARLDAYPADGTNAIWFWVGVDVYCPEDRPYREYDDDGNPTGCTDEAPIGPSGPAGPAALAASGEGPFSVSATVGTPFSKDASEYFTGGTPPLTYSTSDNPSWLTLESSGMMSGTPTVATPEDAPISIEITAQDANEIAASVTVTIAVAAE